MPQDFTSDDKNILDPLLLIMFLHHNEDEEKKTINIILTENWNQRISKF